MVKIEYINGSHIPGVQDTWDSIVITDSQPIQTIVDEFKSFAEERYSRELTLREIDDPSAPRSHTIYKLLRGPSELADILFNVVGKSVENPKNSQPTAMVQIYGLPEGRTHEVMKEYAQTHTQE